MAKAGPPVVVGVGELLWDCFGADRRPGGAPANLAFHADQLDARGLVCSRVGDDEPGRGLLDELRARELDVGFVQVDAEHPTGTVDVDTTRPHDPRYEIHTGVAWDHLEYGGDGGPVPRDAAAICFGTLAQRWSTSRETIHRILEESAGRALRVCDVNLRQSFYTPDRIRRSLELAEVLKLNEREAQVLPALLESATTAGPEESSRRLLEEHGLDVVCVTRGERGCLLVSRDEAVEVPAIEVAVADTVGAGDAFTAAFVVAYLGGHDLATVGRFANEVAALVASRPGAMPPLRNEYAALARRLLTG